MLCKWNIAGGKIECGEICEEALRRETPEETGLEFSAIQQVCVQECINLPECFKPACFLLFNYTASGTSTDVVLNEEDEQLRWLNLVGALQLALNQPTHYLTTKACQERAVLAPLPPESTLLR